MNIGLFVDGFDPQINGVITSVKNLEKELEKRGHKVYIFAPKIGKYEDTINNIVRQPSIKYIFHPEFNMSSVSLKKMLCKAKEWKIDIAHAHTEFSLGIVGSRIAKVMNIPFIFTLHTLWEYYSHYLFWDFLPIKFLRKIFLWFYRKPDYYIIPSKKAEFYLKNVLHIRKRMHTIPTGLKLDLFYNFRATEQSRNDFRKKYGLNKDDIVMVFIGRIGKEKSIDMILRAMPGIVKKHKNIKLLLVGGGPGIKLLKLQSKNLGIEERIVFTGYMAWQDTPQAYKAADIFVNPSTSETQGLVTIEAMACGLPVIVRNDLANLDVIGNGEYGLVFKNAKELTKLVDKLLTNNELRQKFARNSLQASKKYTVQEFGKKMENFYRWVIEDFKKNKLLY